MFTSQKLTDRPAKFKPSNEQISRLRPEADAAAQSILTDFDRHIVTRPTSLEQTAAPVNSGVRAGIPAVVVRSYLRRTTQSRKIAVLFQTDLTQNQTSWFARLRR